MKPVAFSGVQSSMFKWPVRLGLGRSKFGFLISLLLGLYLAEPLSAAIPRPPRNPKPNIIFILADDLGYGDLGCYGQAKIKTPNLDQLAKEGMRFTSFYAGSTVCGPSRAALMTGFHTGHTIIRGNAPNQSLRTNDVTIAQVLDTVGYHCGIIGKWGLGDEGSPGRPSQKGFDEFLGYLDHYHAHDYYTAHLFRYDPRNDFEGRVQFPENEAGAKGVYIHDVFTRSALNYLSINTPQFANRWRPFFLYLAYTIPHANDEEGKRTGNGMQVPSDEPYSREPWPQTEKNKAAMITRLDRDVGRIRDKLHDLKLDDKTIIIFSSDNGPHQEGGVDPKFFQSSGPLRGHKRDMYEGGIRVPMIACWPGKIKAGQTHNAPWAFWDVLPTLAQLTDAKSPENIDGISFLPTLLGQPQTNRHDFLYWEFHERGFQQAVRSGDWKAVRPQADEPLELYNLATDLSEQTNVAKQNPEVVAKMEKYLKAARTESDRWPIRRPPNAKQPPKKS
jgi:arylsulfatase A-like enzyme